MSMFFTLPNSDRMRYVIHSPQTPSQDTVILLTGRGEFIEKYDEVIQRWLDRHFNCIIFDWRSQGLSSRWTQKPELCHLKSMEDLLKDLKAFIHFITPQLGTGRNILMGHSMGGYLALRYLEDPDVPVQSGIIVSPMINISLMGIPLWLVKGFLTCVRSLGFAEYSLPSYFTSPIETVFENNPLTHDLRHFQKLLELYAQRPELFSGQVSYGWLEAALHALPKLTPVVTRPILVLASPDDQVTPFEDTKAFVEKLTNATLIKVPHAGHEILMEKDQIQAKIWKSIDTYTSTYT